MFRRRKKKNAAEPQPSPDLVSLLSALTPDAKPNLHALSLAIKELPLVCLNLKFFGYEMARRLAEALPVRTDTTARHVGLQSKTSVQSDIESDWLAHWCGQLKIPVFYHRKLWELAYVLQAIYEHGFLETGLRGLGFGCGEEPIASYLASRGLSVTVTDLPPDHRSTAGWSRDNQHTATIERAFRENLVDRATFDRQVELQYVDMNRIPNGLRGYDVCWSICALEHVGSIAKGLAFIENAMAVLRPGGLAVHTTELNVRSFGPTPDNWPTVLFQSHHFEALAARLQASGHVVQPFHFELGTGPMDRFIDLPPYHHDLPEQMQQWLGRQAHLKVDNDGFASTCIGIIIRKAA